MQQKKGVNSSCASCCWSFWCFALYVLWNIVFNVLHVIFLALVWFLQHLSECLQSVCWHTLHLEGGDSKPRPLPTKGNVGAEKFINSSLCLYPIHNQFLGFQRRNVWPAAWQVFIDKGAKDSQEMDSGIRWLVWNYSSFIWSFDLQGVCSLIYG